MSREQVTLYGEDAAQWRRIREELGRHLDRDLGNAEAARRLMEFHERTD
ncbi:hypothetical protein [Halocalculus aciditolerans]|nr:hypothetical protein [Halocalculus aciditolerans]